MELVANHLKTKNVLKLYMPIHSGDKEYHCGICEKSFIQKVNFTAHKFIHTGAKPYKGEIVKTRLDINQLLKYINLFILEINRITMK